MDARSRVRLLLRPAGGGLHVVSTGRDRLESVQKSLYGTSDPAAVAERWGRSWDRLAAARVVVIGVPSDVGGGIQRGANQAPLLLRQALVQDDPQWATWLDARGIVDLGDIFCVPQLLHDDMLSVAQREATQDAIFPDVSLDERRTLPVSPLSMLAAVLAWLRAEHPHLRVFVIGGDHSVAWPVSEHVVHRYGPDGTAIVQPDAHTDLLPERLGIRWCFATWAYHANDLLGRGGRLVQVGVRASRHPREHWESTLGVRQFRASDLRSDPQGSLDRLVEHLHRVGTRRVYLSNDIDGTDQEFAASTGTPEPEGLDPAWVETLIRRIGAEFELVAADLVEFAPLLGSERERATSMDTASRYVRASLEGLAR